jgi:hypothetical protein
VDILPRWAPAAASKILVQDIGARGIDVDNVKSALRPTRDGRAAGLCRGKSLKAVGRLPVPAGPELVPNGGPVWTWAE